MPAYCAKLSFENRRELSVPLLSPQFKNRSARFLLNFLRTFRNFGVKTALV